MLNNKTSLFPFKYFLVTSCCTLIHLLLRRSIRAVTIASAKTSLAPFVFIPAV